MRDKTRNSSTEFLDLVRVSDVESKPINWLWPGRIAKAKVSLIAGHPGQGKSTVTASIAAIVSSGGLWPVDEVPAEPGNVVILSAEDDIADTLRPRLVTAGADIDRVQVIRGVFGQKKERIFSLSKDLEKLEELNASLLIIDPISAYLDGVDSHKNAEVRSLLTPLSDLAVEKEMAILCVSHLNKSESLDAMSRVSGSMAFVATARAVYLVAADREDDARRLFFPLKNNIGPDSDGLAFRIEPRYLDGGIETSTVVWESESVPNPIAGAGLQPTKNSALRRAKEFLKGLLLDGSVKASCVQEEGRLNGHSWATLRRAAKCLNVSKSKQSMDGPWVWSLPSSASEDAQGVQRSKVGTFESFEHLRETHQAGRDDE